jgi:hypothetical protein
MLKSSNAHVATDPLVRPAGPSPAARCTAWATRYAQVALLIPLLVRSLPAADCLSIHQAAQHIGETKCVSGKVLNVKVGNKGVHFLDFCEDAMACPFTVVVFAGDLKDVGDVRLLSGRNIEIRGALKMYDGRPEIILNRISQIEGGAAMIPPLPKNYDVEYRGRFSAGRLYPGKKPKKAKPQRPSSTATYGNDVERDDSQ